MELRGDEARTKVEALGGPETIAQKLKTSTTNGINSDDTGNGSDCSVNCPTRSARNYLVRLILVPAVDLEMYPNHENS